MTAAHERALFYPTRRPNPMRPPPAIATPKAMLLHRRPPHSRLASQEVVELDVHLCEYRLEAVTRTKGDR
jgi:hypothetical protein